MPRTLGGQRERLGLIAIHRGMTAHQPKAPAHICLMFAHSLSLILWLWFTKEPSVP